MKTVLYIEDNAVNVLLVEEILAARPDLRLLTAMSGRVGLDVVQQQHPDLILLDMQLPDMDGAAFLGELRRFDGTTPVIVVSATIYEPAEMQSLGVAAFITKPFELSEFERLVDACLANQGEPPVRAY